jgi:hypothetical protein
MFMIKVLLVAFSLFMPLKLFSDALPLLEVPEKYFQCEQNSDCAVAGDSCRSCGELTIINKKYLNEFNEMDQKLRTIHNAHRTCEACDTSLAELKCVEMKCLQGSCAP